MHSVLIAYLSRKVYQVDSYRCGGSSEQICMHNMPIVHPILSYDGFIFRYNKIVLMCNYLKRMSFVQRTRVNE